MDLHDLLQGYSCLYKKRKNGEDCYSGNDLDLYSGDIPQSLLPSFPSALQLRVSFALLNNLPPFFSTSI
jgi:hypothetical protein